LFSWCASTTWRRDVELAQLVSAAASRPEFCDRVAVVARDRIIEGPLRDAPACAPRLGEILHAGPRVAEPASVEARARLEILVWEAGASALEAPDLGAWLGGSRQTFDAMIRAPGRRAPGPRARREVPRSKRGGHAGRESPRACRPEDPGPARVPASSRAA